MEKNKETKIKALYLRIEKLPWYCTLILIGSFFVLFLTIGLAVGILLQKDKITKINSQLTQQKEEEEKKIETIIKSYQKKNITPQETTSSPR